MKRIYNKNSGKIPVCWGLSFFDFVEFPFRRCVWLCWLLAAVDWNVKVLRMSFLAYSPCHSSWEALGVFWWEVQASGNEFSCKIKGCQYRKLREKDKIVFRKGDTMKVMVIIPNCWPLFTWKMIWFFSLKSTLLKYNLHKIYSFQVYSLS